MRTGDKLMLRPYALTEGAGMLNTQPRPCRVVYIHPKGRFYVVEFRSSVTGQTWWEARYDEPCP